MKTLTAITLLFPLSVMAQAVAIVGADSSSQPLPLGIHAAPPGMPSGVPPQAIIPAEAPAFNLPPAPVAQLPAVPAPAVPPSTTASPSAAGQNTLAELEKLERELALKERRERVGRLGNPADAKPSKPKENLHVLVIYGVNGRMTAELIDEQGAIRTVQAGDKAGSRRIQDITINGVRVSGGKGKPVMLPMADSDPRAGADAAVTAQPPSMAGGIPPLPGIRPGMPVR